MATGSEKTAPALLLRFADGHHRAPHDAGSLSAGAEDGSDRPADGRGDAADSKPGVLVVEDNDDVRELAESVLLAAGYAVRTAASGEQALDLVKGGARVDLLFTDVIMPGGMNGLELVEKLRHQRSGHPGQAVPA